MKSCPSEEVFVDWLEARLEPAASATLDAHLDECPTCRTLYAELARLGVSGSSVATVTDKPLYCARQTPMIGRFEVERTLGQGGMGTVFLARDPDLDRQVAVKVLGAGGHHERLLREARAQATLSHPNVVQVYEVGTGGSGPYIAMEYIEGETLREWIRRDQPWREVIAAFRAAARGLLAAHQKGLVHRDFKPANVLIGRDGRVAVTDFGLAASDAPGALHRRFPRALTETGAVVGTPAYMAPEQMRGERVTAAADLFAFAVSLFEGLYAVRPFAGDDVAEIHDNIAAGNVRPPPLESDVPSAWRDLLIRMLAPAPEARLASMADFLDVAVSIVSASAATRECPFPGLAAFGVDDSDIFFGRDAEVEEGVRKLAASGFLAVVGPSGAGKSSYVRAGLIPALRQRGRVIDLEFRPGPAPARRVGALLEDLDVGIDDGVGLVREQPERVGDLVASYAARHHGLVILVIDQLEELFTLNESEVDAAAVVAVLESLAAHRQSVRVVVTMRSDLLERAQAHRNLLRKMVDNLLFLANPDRVALHAALVRPLEGVGYRFESDDIPQMIAAELDCMHGALPLLQFAARRLWSQADRNQRLITLGSFHQLGKVAGLLADHASSVMAALGPADRSLAREVLVRLVTAERTRAVVPLSELERLSDGGGGNAEAVIETLVKARLIVKSDGDPPTAELIHESLIDRWPALRRWLDESDQGDALLAELTEAARRWRTRDRPAGLLWRGESADRLERFVSSHRGALSESEREFANAVLGDARRARRRRRAVVSAAFVVLTALVLASAVAIVLIRDAASSAKKAAVEARSAEKEAVEQRAAASAEASRAVAAEKELESQLEALRKEQAERQAAEDRAAKNAKELSLTYDELKAALLAAQRESERATNASKKAETAAEREREQRKRVEELLADKKAELERLRKERAKINTSLKGAP